MISLDNLFNSSSIMTLAQASIFAKKSQLEYLLEEVKKMHPNTQEDMIEFVAMYKKHKK